MANGLVEKIYSLINKSNETTGKTDTDLTGCIKSLAEGYGSEGFPIAIKGLENSLTVKENVGKVYKCADKLYQVHNITSLKGLTIKFNKHITPCPVLGDNEFECSCISYVSEDMVWYEHAWIGKIAKDFYNYFSSDIAFEVTKEGYGDPAYVFYGSFNTDEEPRWLICDPLGNTTTLYGNKSFVVTQFDCPTLNENAEFIDWVMSNAKVYSKIENVKDIKGIKFSQTYIGDLNLILAMEEVTGNMFGMPLEAKGKFTATFSVNGELITKTFSTFFSKYYPESDYGEVVAYFSDGEGEENRLCFEFVGYNEEKDWTTEYNLKYNGIALDDGVSFTTFDCGEYNESYFMLGFLLSYTDIIAGYAAIREFITPVGTLEVTTNGNIDVKGYEKAEVNVVETNEGLEIAILGGAY